MYRPTDPNAPNYRFVRPTYPSRTVPSVRGETTPSSRAPVMLDRTQAEQVAADIQTVVAQNTTVQAASVANGMGDPPSPFGPTVPVFEKKIVPLHERTAKAGPFSLTYKWSADGGSCSSENGMIVGNAMCDPATRPPLVCPSGYVMSEEMPSVPGITARRCVKLPQKGKRSGEYIISRQQAPRLERGMALLAAQEATQSPVIATPPAVVGPVTLTATPQPAGVAVGAVHLTPEQREAGYTVPISNLGQAAQEAIAVFAAKEDTPISESSITLGAPPPASTGSFSAATAATGPTAPAGELLKSPYVLAGILALILLMRK